jgi:hypothetical protein
MFEDDIVVVFYPSDNGEIFDFVPRLGVLKFDPYGMFWYLEKTYYRIGNEYNMWGDEPIYKLEDEAGYLEFRIVGNSDDK